MKLLLVLVSITLCVSEKRQTSLQKGYGYQDTCIANQHVVKEFRAAFDAFTIKLYKIVAPKGKYFLALSPQAIWITLAAIAEGADYNTQSELFRILNLPQNPCSREKFYHVATSRTPSSPYVNVINTRALVIDQNAQINPNWHNFVSGLSLLQVIPAPIKNNPAGASKIIDQFIPLKNRRLNFSGNSVMINSLDFNGLWTTAFPDAKIQRTPFYGLGGQRIGSVDLMRVKRRVRVGYAPSLNCKIIELPIGINKEYAILFGLVVNENPDVEPAIIGMNNFTMAETIASLQESYLPIDIGIPRFVIDSEIDMRHIVEDLGIVILWNDPGATRYISAPSAHPTSYIHRVRMTLSSDGVYQPPLEHPTYPHGTDEERYWGEFIADRPFMFALIDAETQTTLMAAMITKPTYEYPY